MSNTNVDLIGLNGRCEGEVANQILGNGQMNLGSMTQYNYNPGLTFQLPRFPNP